ncbi:MAG: Nramp family divalent metal transporter [Terrimonas sp.]|nr:Nramp family divalent metal transporter [Terrimonas sp.]
MIKKTGKLKSGIYLKIKLSTLNVRQLLTSLTPGLITAALIFGPSKMTITSKLGAQFGYSLLWIVGVAIFFMCFFSNMAVRIGMALDKSVLTVVAEKFGRKAAIALGVCIFIVCASFQSGNSTGVGISLGELTDTSPVIWVVIVNALSILLLFTKNIYKMLERVMISLIAIMLLSFVVTFIIVKPEAKAMAEGLVPRIPDGSLGLVIAFGASFISIVGAFYQAYLVNEKRKASKGKPVKYDSVFGILVLGTLSVIVMICAAVVLHPAGIKVTKATDMSLALIPAFGKSASYVFLIGLFGAAFSSLIGNASAGGTLLSDAIGKSSKVGGATSRWLTAAIIIVGAVISIIFGSAPLQLIVLAQSITIFIVPVIGFTLFYVSNNKALMGSYVNTVWMKLVIGTGMALIVIMAFFNFKELFLK